MLVPARMIPSAEVLEPTASHMAVLGQVTPLRAADAAGTDWLTHVVPALSVVRIAPDSWVI